jgi:hypothetical protein
MRSLHVSNRVARQARSRVSVRACGLARGATDGGPQRLGSLEPAAAIEGYAVSRPISRCRVSKVLNSALNGVAA